MNLGTSGVVYFIEAPGLGRIKIGFTQNIKKRLRDLQGCSPVPLKLIKTVQATIQAEQTLLFIFHKYRTHGEWFVAHESLVSFIDSLEDRAVFSPEMLVQK